MRGNKPEFKLQLASKHGERKRYSSIGVAWSNDFGGFSIQLNPGVVLSWRDLDEFYLNLVPEKKQDGSDPVDLGLRGGYTDEIPF